MKVSIIIPAYNAEKYLPLTLDSVLGQTFQQWELIIVDDGSQDSTRSIAEAYAAQDSRVRVVHQQNGGVAVARNQGYARTSPETEAVIFLDNDDIWEPEALAVLTAALERHPEAAGAYVMGRYIDGAGQPIRVGMLEDWMRARRKVEGSRVVAILPSEFTTFSCFALEQWLPSPGVLLMRRAALEAVGGFDQATAPCDDYDLYFRLTRRGGLIFVDRPLFGYRLHGGNVSDDKRRLNRSERGVRRRQRHSPENTSEQERLISVGYRLHEREVCLDRIRWAWDSLCKRQVVAAARHFLLSQVSLVRSLQNLS